MGAGCPGAFPGTVLKYCPMGKHMFYKAMLKFVERRLGREDSGTMLEEIFEKYSGNSAKQGQYHSLSDGKLLCVADLHSFFPEDRARAKELDFSRYTAVIFLGDIKKNDAAYIAGLVPEGVPCLYVYGNHDEPGQYEQIHGLINIEGKRYVLKNGLTIGGTGGSRPVKNADTVSQLSTKSERETRKALKKVGNVDILVTHESPFHLMDIGQTHSGYRAFTKYIRKNSPTLHIFGHHHWPCSQMVQDTNCICVYKFEEVDLKTGKAFQLPGF